MTEVVRRVADVLGLALGDHALDDILDQIVDRIVIPRRCTCVCPRAVAAREVLSRLPDLVDWLDANRGRIIETMHSQFGPNTSFEGDWVGEPEGWGGQDWDTQAIQTVFNFPGDTDLDDALRAVSESQAVNEVYKDVVKHRLLGIRLVFALDTTPCRPPEEQDMDDWCSDADANDRNITDEQAAGILRHVVATNCLRWPAEKNLSLKSSRVLAQFAHANTRPPKRAFLEALHEEWLASRGDVPRRLRLANLSGWANEHLSD